MRSAPSCTLELARRVRLTQRLARRSDAAQPDPRADLRRRQRARSPHPNPLPRGGGVFGRRRRLGGRLGRERRDGLAGAFEVGRRLLEARRLHLAARALQHPLRVADLLAHALVRLGAQSLALVGQRRELPLEVAAQLLGGVAVGGGAGGAVLGSAELRAQIAEHRLEVALAVRKPLARGLDDRAGHPQPLGDRERVGLARHADAQPVGRRQRLHVELHGGVEDARLAVREQFQLAVVRGRDQGRARLDEPPDDRDRQRGALGRVGAGAQLVEQHERARPGAFENVDDRRDVA